jgi:hypothetical protein
MSTYLKAYCTVYGHVLVKPVYKLEFFAHMFALGRQVQCTYAEYMVVRLIFPRHFGVKDYFFSLALQGAACLSVCRPLSLLQARIFSPQFVGVS